MRPMKRMTSLLKLSKKKLELLKIKEKFGIPVSIGNSIVLDLEIFKLLMELFVESLFCGKEMLKLEFKDKKLRKNIGRKKK
jgi:hypothetical protein